MFVNRSGQNVQSLERIFYRCFLPSFSSFGRGVFIIIVIILIISLWLVFHNLHKRGCLIYLCLWQEKILHANQTYRSLKKRSRNGVSEEKIKMWKVNGRLTTSDGKNSHCLWQVELKRGWYRTCRKHMENQNCYVDHMSLVKKTNVNFKNKQDPELVKIYSIINIQTFLSYFVIFS
jgi:hypothetical protein